MTAKPVSPLAKDSAQILANLRSEIKKLDAELSTRNQKDIGFNKLFMGLIGEIGSLDLHRLMNFLEQSDRPVVFDCGGYDGCSAILLRLLYPGHDCVTFEPNPAMWQYYDEIDTFLVRAAVSNSDGITEILIDDIDGDGSTLAGNSKAVYFKKGIDANSSAISMPIMCANLANILERAYASRRSVVLKLDIEGAEYEILDDIARHHPSVLARLESFYCEFHGEKMTGDKEWRREIEKITNALHPVEPWDSTPLSVMHKNEKNILLRKHLIKAISETSCQSEQQESKRKLEYPNQ